MGDPLKPVHGGQRFFPSAARENAISDLMRQAKAGGLGGSGGAGPVRCSGRNPSDGCVLVKNNTGAARAAFEVVALSEPIFGPADNLGEFQFRFALKGVTPTVAYRGRFAVLQKPLGIGKIGRAMVDGLTVVKIKVAADVHRWADVCLESGDQSTWLVSSGAGGAAEILWLGSEDLEPENEDADVRWALVRLGATPRILWGKIVALFDSTGAAYSDGWTTERHVAFATIHPCDAAGNHVDSGTTVYVAFQSAFWNPIYSVCMSWTGAFGVSGWPVNAIIPYDPSLGRSGTNVGDVVGTVVGRWLDVLPMVLKTGEANARTDWYSLGGVHGMLTSLALAYGGGVWLTGRLWTVDIFGRLVQMQVPHTLCKITATVTVDGHGTIPVDFALDQEFSVLTP